MESSAMTQPLTKEQPQLLRDTFFNRTSTTGLLYEDELQVWRHQLAVGPHPRAGHRRNQSTLRGYALPEVLDDLWHLGAEDESEHDIGSESESDIPGVDDVSTRATDDVEMTTLPRMQAQQRPKSAPTVLPRESSGSANFADRALDMLHEQEHSIGWVRRTSWSTANGRHGQHGPEHNRFARTTTDIRKGKEIAKARAALAQHRLQLGSSASTKRTGLFGSLQQVSRATASRGLAGGSHVPCLCRCQVSWLVSTTNSALTPMISSCFP